MSSENESLNDQIHQINRKLKTSEERCENYKLDAA